MSAPQAGDKFLCCDHVLDEQNVPRMPSFWFSGRWLARFRFPDGAAAETEIGWLRLCRDCKSLPQAELTISKAMVLQAAPIMRLWRVK